jgi:hypothetical protein
VPAIRSNLNLITATVTCTHCHKLTAVHRYPFPDSPDFEPTEVAEIRCAHCGANISSANSALQARDISFGDYFVPGRPVFLTGEGHRLNTWDAGRFAILAILYH